MKRFIKKLLFCIAISFVVPFALANAYYSLGEPKGYVNDYANILTQQQKQELENTIKELEKSTKVEIAVVIIQSLKGDTIENFANELFEEWGIGKKEEDNGILILTAVQDKQVRIEVGYGLEPIITDAFANSVIKNSIIPEYKKGNYYQGLKNAVSAISLKINKGKNPQAIASNTPQESHFYDWLYIIVLAGFLLEWLVSLMARDKSIWLGGILGFFIGAFIGWIITEGVSIWAILIGTGVGFLLDWIVSREYKFAKKQKRSPRWWGGGTNFGGGSSSFSGFGGGSSGGGGASGKW